MLIMEGVHIPQSDEATSYRIRHSDPGTIDLLPTRLPRFGQDRRSAEPPALTMPSRNR
jgi:hypothetical protein